MEYQIVCIEKDNGHHENRHTAISLLGWMDSNGKSDYSSRIQMYDFVKNGGRAFVRDIYGNKAYLMTSISAFGTKYVKTVADETKADNLLSLTECTV
jgi:hypothetical protein